MAIPVWPDDLPERPLQQGYSRGLGDGRLFSQRDAGPPGVRRRTSAAVKPVSAQIVCTTDQLARFERFWEEDTVGGKLPFLLRDPVFDGVPVLTENGASLVTEAGDPIIVSAWKLVRFDRDQPAAQPLGGLYHTVSFGLLILPV